MSATHIVTADEVMACFDGELAPPRAQFVHAHVAGCDECGGMVDHLRGLSAALGEWRVESAPASLVAPVISFDAFSLANRVTQRSSGGGSSFLRVASAVPLAVRWGAAAALVVAVGGAFVLARLPGRAWPPVPSSAVGVGAGVVAGVTNGVVGGIAPQAEGFGARSMPDDTATADSITLESLPEAKKTMQAQPAAPEARMIARTATLGLASNKFDDMRSAIERTAARHRGTITAYTLSADPGSARSMSMTVRVEAEHVPYALADLRALGTVTSEAQATEDITDVHRDLAIRIENAKREATRLNELLTRQTDRLSDVLAVEQAQARVQTEIEQMTAQEAAMAGRATYGSIVVEVTELRRAELALGALPIGARLRNALVDGARAAIESAVAAVILAIGFLPVAAVWCAMFLVVALPMWKIWRMLRARRLRRA